MHATDYLRKPQGVDTGAMVVLSGAETHLRTLALKQLIVAVLGTEDDAEASLSRFDGRTAEWKNVRDELLTVSMWSDRRLVIVDDADEFVTAHRAALEKYVVAPSQKSLLVLAVKSFPKTTKLAKSVTAKGLEIECSELKGDKLLRWLTESARANHGKELPRDAALLMTELAGSSIGLLDQELNKLASYIGNAPRITAEDVRKLVGGWKVETTFAMLDAIRDGQIDSGLCDLDRLLQSGEAPLRILGGVTYFVRKMATATELSRAGTPLRDALRQAGIFPQQIDAAERYLKRLTRAKAENFFRWLQEADNALKGGSRNTERLVLELLMMRLAGKA